MYELAIGASRIELILGDITRQATDAIVNAANSGLRGGGGVDGAIHRLGGPAIMAECRRLGGCPTGDAKSTTAGLLVAKHVIHAVGPIFRDGDHGEAEMLASAYRRSMQIAAELQLRSVSFPSLSTGAYGYPIATAAAIALTTVSEVLRAGGPIELVRFVLFSSADLAVYADALSRLAAARAS